MTSLDKVTKFKSDQKWHYPIHMDVLTLLDKVKKFKSDAPNLLKSSQDPIRKG